MSTGSDKNRGFLFCLTYARMVILNKKGKSGMIFLKNKRAVGLLASAAVCAVLLSGCTDERMEDELAYRKIGITSMENGDYEGAAAAFDSALKQHAGRVTSAEIDICYYKAAALYASGDVQGALEVCDALTGYDEKDGDAYFLKGCLLLQTGDPKQAQEAFDNAVKYHKEDFELYIRIYENLAAHGLAAEGETYLNKAFEIKGDSAEVLALRGKMYCLLGQYDNAVTELTAALEKDSAQANLYLAQTYEGKGDTAKAETYYQAYLASGAADSAAVNALAEMEMEKGNYQTALSYLGQGLALAEVPNREALMRNEIICSEFTGDFVRAWEVVQEYVALYPEDEEAQREYIFLKCRQTDAGGPMDAGGTESVPEGTEGTEAQPGS